MKKPARSYEHRAASELNWLLYITEGYIANVAKAVSVNNYTLDKDALITMKCALRDAESTARRIRNQIKRRKP